MLTDTDEAARASWERGPGKGAGLLLARTRERKMVRTEQRNVSQIHALGTPLPLCGERERETEAERPALGTTLSQDQSPLSLMPATGWLLNKYLMNAWDARKDIVGWPKRYDLYHQETGEVWGPGEEEGCGLQHSGEQIGRAGPWDRETMTLTTPCRVMTPSSGFPESGQQNLQAWGGVG